MTFGSSPGLSCFCLLVLPAKQQQIVQGRIGSKLSINGPSLSGWLQNSVFFSKKPLFCWLLRSGSYIFHPNQVCCLCLCRESYEAKTLTDYVPKMCQPISPQEIRNWTNLSCWLQYPFHHALWWQTWSLPSLSPGLTVGVCRNQDKLTCGQTCLY